MIAHQRDIGGQQRIPLSVMTIRSGRNAVEQLQVVSRRVSKVCRLRLLIPIRGELNCNASSSSAAIMDFNQHRHAQRLASDSSLSIRSTASSLADVLQTGRRHAERRDNYQDAICSHRPGLNYLIFVQHEIFAQYRQITSGSGLLQIFRAAAKKLPVG